jgi:tetratricopeptide (TPR) repeat protein
MAKQQKTVSVRMVPLSTAVAMVAAALALGLLIGVNVPGVFRGGETAAPQAQAPAGGMPSAAAPQAQAGPDAGTMAHIAELEAKAKAAPGEAKAWVELGNAAFDADLPERAIPAYETALKLSPNLPDVWVDLGVMYRETGQAQKAVEAFDHAFLLDSRHEISRLNKGIVLLHDVNDPAGAIRAWEQLLAINPQARTPSGQGVAELVKELKAKNPEPGLLAPPAK